MDFDLYALGPRPRDIGSLARTAEDLGFAALWLTESAHHAFVSSAMAAVDSREMTIGTNIAVAFPRSPMITAQAAWDLADATSGRFVLGLGSQVKAHVKRRFSAEFSQPAARLREYVQALRAIWAAFQGNAPLDFDGDFYSFSLLTDFFSPGPIDHPDVPVFLAGVNTGMASVAGAVADGFHVHPVHSVRYLHEVLRPAIAAGAATVGRDPSTIDLAVPVFIAVGARDEDITRRRESIRRQIGFYGSTPSYRRVFELHGWDDVADKLNRAQRERDERGLIGAVTDEVVDEFSVTATWDDLATALLDRYSGLATRVFPYGLVAWDDPRERERWGDVVRSVRAAQQRQP